MIEKTIKLYEFEELSDNIKEKVLNAFREQNDYSFLEDYLTESLNELLKENGIESLSDNPLNYSLSYSQGDGVYLIGEFNFKGKWFKINGKYNNDIITEDSDDNEDITEELNEILFNEFDNIIETICEEIKKEGYDFIEYEDSDNAIKETIKFNEYTFRFNGDIENL